MRFPVSATGLKTDFERDWYVAQGFGNPQSYGFHDGADINLRSGGDTDLGQEVKAIANGRIVYYHFNSHKNTSGSFIVPTFGLHSVYKIDGPWGTRWVHQTHLDPQDFKTSGDVTEGQIIGRVGKSGTTAAHLHFSIFKVDPGTFGIDNVPNTLTELNQYWEDPITFINTWMTVAPTPQPIITDQTRIPQIENMEVQAIRSERNDNIAKIANLESIKSNLESKIANAKSALG